jgi:uncharacterized protein (TIGR02246 family)
MKRATILAVLLSIALLPAQAAQSEAEAQIRSVLNAQTAAWNRGDLDAFMETYWKSAKTVFAGSSGVFRGWQAVLDRYKRAYPSRAAMGTVAFTSLEVTQLAPDAALAIGHWHLKRSSDNLGGVFTLVLRKFPNGWKIILDHTSAINPPPEN